jgi:hypothetical protein
VSDVDLIALLPLILATVLVGVGLIGGRLHAATRQTTERVFALTFRLGAAALALGCAAAWLYQRDAWSTAIAAVAFAVIAIWPPRGSAAKRIDE